MSRVDGPRISGEKFLEFARPAAPDPDWEPASAPPRRRSRLTRIAIMLAICTLFSTFWAGVANWAPTNPFAQSWMDGSLLACRMIVLANWQGGLQFSLALMGILAAHEFGHYLLTLYYRVPSTPPLFIPFPISPIGTCGAVIAMQGGEADRRQIFDIGLAGPIAGLVVAIPILIYALWYPQPMEYVPYRVMKIGHPLLIQWLAQWLVPEQIENYVSMANTETSPLLMAAWVGLLVTGFNMIPIGQLDGGHVTFGLLGRRSTWVGIAAIVASGAYIVAYALLYQQLYIFSLMFILVLLMGPKHPPSRDDSRQLGLPRQIIGWLSLAIPILCIPAHPIVPF